MVTLDPISSARTVDRYGLSAQATTRREMVFLLTASLGFWR